MHCGAWSLCQPSGAERNPPMSEISWVYVALFAASDIAMERLSCLAGMRLEVENPADRWLA